MLATQDKSKCQRFQTADVICSFIIYKQLIYVDVTAILVNRMERIRSAQAYKR